METVILPRFFTTQAVLRIGEYHSDIPQIIVNGGEWFLSPANIKGTN